MSTAKHYLQFEDREGKIHEVQVPAIFEGMRFGGITEACTHGSTTRLVWQLPDGTRPSIEMPEDYRPDAGWKLGGYRREPEGSQVPVLTPEMLKDETRNWSDQANRAIEPMTPRYAVLLARAIMQITTVERFRDIIDSIDYSLLAEAGREKAMLFEEVVQVCETALTAMQTGIDSAQKLAMDALNGSLPPRTIVMPPAWISVKERLPELEEYVLVSNPDGKMAVMRMVKTCPGSTRFDVYTHWMPLPAPPQRGSRYRRHPHRSDVRR